MGETNEQGQLSKAYGFNPIAAQQGLWSIDPIWQADTHNGSLTDAQTQYHYLHTDHLGTPQLATTKEGTTSWKAQSEAFGAAGVLQNQSSISMNLRLPGQYYDEETNSHYNFHRDYRPNLGRYLQSDPIGLNGDDNLYAYVYGRPLIIRDQTGLSSEPCCDPKLSDAQCCNQIPTNDQGLFIIGGATAGGTVMCCQGRKITCIAKKYTSGDPSIAIIGKCIEEHERKHFDHVGECPSNCSPFLMTHQGDVDHNECEAYAVEINCLRRSIQECGSNTLCRVRVNAEISATRQTGKNQYGCSL